MKLRDYQTKVKNKVLASWGDGALNVLAVMPTGAGKTVLLSDIIKENVGASAVIAHRQELVSQISLALAVNGVRHRLIAPNNVIKFIVSQHIADTGQSWYEPASLVAVAGVDTIVRRVDELGDWLASVRLWVIDEAHHVVTGNKWGKAVELFPNARGLGVTATPLRADGKGLGRHADGVFDVMVEGPSMRGLIDRKFLTEYRIFAPPSDLDLSDVKMSKATGDYNKDGVKRAVRSSQITGDVVKHYQRIAPGKLGVTFATDVETATEIAAQFNEAGIAAEVVSAKTKPAVRAEVLRRFKARQIMMLVNVDLFGEGFDLPAIEVVIMARPTASYGLFVQQFGRALRIMSGKIHALIIDHVNNVIRHGLPDAPREWTLDRREKRSSGTPDDVIPVRSCPACTGVYEKIHKSCPYCGFVTVPAARSSAEFVDGDLHELDAETLAAMRAAVESVDMDNEDYRARLVARGAPPIGQMAGVKRHAARKDAQESLRHTIAVWGGFQRSHGRSDSESYRRFYFNYGIDVMSAQALGTKEAEELQKRMEGHEWK